MSTPTSSTTRARLEREQWRAKIQRALQELRGSLSPGGDHLVQCDRSRSGDAPSSAFEPSV